MVATDTLEVWVQMSFPFDDEGHTFSDLYWPYKLGVKHAKEYIHKEGVYPVRALAVTPRGKHAHIWIEGGEGAGMSKIYYRVTQAEGYEDEEDDAPNPPKAA